MNDQRNKQIREEEHNYNEVMCLPMVPPVGHVNNKFTHCCRQTMTGLDAVR